MKYLEILISLIFIYLLLSIFCSIIMEFISTFFRMRASTLQKSIAKILGSASVDDDIVKEFYKVPMIKMIGEETNAFFSLIKNSNLPHQIDSKTFKDAIMYMLNTHRGNESVDSKVSSEGINEQSTEISVAKLDLQLFKEDTKKFFQFHMDKSNGDIPKFENEIERWYNVVQERTVTWYKRKVQYILIIIGILIAILFNADSIRIVSELNQNDKLRTELVKAAGDYVQNAQKVPNSPSSANAEGKKPSESEDTMVKLDSLQKTIILEYNNAMKQSQSLLGWQREVNEKPSKKLEFPELLLKFFGFLLTGFAVSLGATFWFDMLKKVLDLKVLGTNK